MPRGSRVERVWHRWGHLHRLRHWPVVLPGAQHLRRRRFQRRRLGWWRLRCWRVGWWRSNCGRVGRWRSVCWRLVCWRLVCWWLVCWWFGWRRLGWRRLRCWRLSCWWLRWWVGGLRRIVGGMLDDVRRPLGEHRALRSVRTTLWERPDLQPRGVPAAPDRLHHAGRELRPRLLLRPAVATMSDGLQAQHRLPGRRLLLERHVSVPDRRARLRPAVRSQYLRQLVRHVLSCMPLGERHGDVQRLDLWPHVRSGSVPP